MKKIMVGITVVFLLFFTLALEVKVNAGTQTAEIKGFQVSNFYYNVDSETTYYYIETEDNYYGKIRLWSAIYSVIDISANSMFYAVLWEAEIESSTFSNVIKSFANRRIELKVAPSHSSFIATASYPNSNNFSGGYEVSSTINFTLGLFTGFSALIGFSTNSFYKEIELIKSTENGNENRVKYDFDFTRYSVNSVSQYAPYRGNYKQQGMVIYEIRNYSDRVASLNNETIIVTFKGSIFKDHWINNVTLSGNREIVFKFDSASQQFK